MNLSGEVGDEDVKAETFLALRGRGLTVRTEVRLPAVSSRSRAKNFRADLVVYSGKEPAVVIEAKAHRDTMGTRQRENYRGCGLPAVLVTAESMPAVVDSVVAYVSDGTPIAGCFLVQRSRTTESGAPQRLETWLTPYGDAWTKAYGGKPPWGQMARELIDFHKVDAAECLRNWRHYLSATPGRFASAARFSQTYGEWSAPRNGSRADPLDQLPGEDLDAYVARLHRMTSR